MSDTSDLQARVRAEAEGGPFVYWRDGDGIQHILQLRPDSRVTVGRRTDQTISLHWDTEVSRVHASLEPVGNQWVLVDEGSRNGSYIDGARVASRRPLLDRECMTFGTTRVTFRDPLDAATAPPTTRAPAGPRGVPISQRERDVLRALCRPIVRDEATTPATNKAIAREIHATEESVKAHMRTLFVKFGCADFPQNEKRARLAVIVLDSGILAIHDF